MATVRVRVLLDPPIGVSFGVLGRRFEIPTEFGPAEAELPRFEWVDDCPRVLPPTGATTAESSWFSEAQFREDDRTGWGQCWSWSPESKEGAVHVGALLVSIDVDDELIGRSQYAYGVGRPIGAVVDGVRRSIADWRSGFVDWVALISGQAVSPELPPLPSRVTDAAAGTLLWTESGGKTIGLPSHQLGQFTVETASAHEVVGFTLDEDVFERVLALACSEEPAPAELRLLLRGRIAVQRKEYRVAMIELGSAAELCLWKVFERTVRPATDKELATWTLGTLVREVYSEKDPRRDEFLQGVVEPRNDAIHRSLDCDRSVALSAFTLVRKVVSDEQPDRLVPLSIDTERWRQEIGYRKDHLEQFTGLPEEIWEAHRRVAAALDAEG